VAQLHYARDADERDQQRPEHRREQQRHASGSVGLAPKMLIFTRSPFCRMKISRSSSTTTAAIEATQIPLTRVRGGTAVWTGGAAGGTSGPAPVAPGDGARSGSGTPLRSSYIGPVMVAIYPGRPPVMPGTTPACSGSGTPGSVVEEC